MKNEYTFGRDTYIYDNKNGVKISSYTPMAPPQKQDGIVGVECIMNPRPIFDDPNYKASGKLEGKVAIITGGDSGLGRAAAIAFAKEGADIVIPYFNEHIDANETKQIIESYNRSCLILSGDISDKSFCEKIVKEAIKRFGKIDILVNNAGVQYQSDS